MFSKRVLKEFRVQSVICGLCLGLEFKVSLFSIFLTLYYSAYFYYYS